jgi:phosphoribosylformylglycinamidine synthase
VRNTWTPTLHRYEDVGETILLFVDLAQGRQAMGGSALAQTMEQIGNESPDVRDVDLISDFFDALSQLQESGIVLAYHDRSDGGLFTTLVEMMFAGRCGAEIMLDGIAKSEHLFDILNALFNEELGAVFQVRKSDEINFRRCFATCGPPPGLIRKNRSGSCNFKTEVVYPLWSTVASQSWPIRNARMVVLYFTPDTTSPRQPCQCRL